jgi:hypothetical protein
MAKLLQFKNCDFGGKIAIAAPFLWLNQGLTQLLAAARAPTPLSQPWMFTRNVIHH